MKRMFEWMGWLVVATSRDRAWALLCDRLVDHIVYASRPDGVTSMQEAMHNRLGHRAAIVEQQRAYLDVDPIEYLRAYLDVDPIEYLRACEPDEEIELDWWQLPSGSEGGEALCPSGFMSQSGPAREWATLLPEGWMLDQKAD